VCGAFAWAGPRVRGCCTTSHAVVAICTVASPVVRAELALCASSRAVRAGRGFLDSEVLRLRSSIEFKIARVAYSVIHTYISVHVVCTKSYLYAYIISEGIHITGP